ncbi:hypothetical protein [Wukongibacter sp. M2B1]|uniref:hypothetical protein n=1 Tax=Wukongibacter sp. M2B1 TaxID=3088895 RepID=UPI003D7ADDAF
MNIERAKETIHNNKRVIVIVLISILMIGIFFYLKAFFTKGAYFEGVFLEKEVIGEETNYIGRTIDGDIQIIVNKLEEEKGKIEAIFKLPNNITRKFNISFEDNAYKKTQTITNELGDVIFEGSYESGSMILFDKNGEILFDETIRMYLNKRNETEDRFPKNYEVSLLTITQFAYGENETIRGKSQFLAIAIILSIITIIDMRYPLLFFQLRHSLSVQDPEPTEIYVLIQRISWVIYPIIIIGCLIAGVS